MGPMSETLIREAVQAARAKGLRIVRGATFDSSGAVNATGAVLLSMGFSHTASGWVDALCTHLGQNSFWLWRFWMGWDRHFTLKTTDDKGREHVDDVSAWAHKLAKELCD